MLPLSHPALLQQVLIWTTGVLMHLLAWLFPLAILNQEMFDRIIKINKEVFSSIEEVEYDN